VSGISQAAVVVEVKLPGGICIHKFTVVPVHVPSEGLEDSDAVSLAIDEVAHKVMEDVDKFLL